MIIYLPSINQYRSNVRLTVIQQTIAVHITSNDLQTTSHSNTLYVNHSPITTEEPNQHPTTTIIQ
ncbi:hypothetical protein [Escherichia phage dw-ec]|nr:hypothetical protein [Escherichia phage BI-EHEC]UJQ43755.1 hypothetical protein [Escherichia phage dw-ec]